VDTELLFYTPSIYPCRQMKLYSESITKENKLAMHRSYCLFPSKNLKKILQLDLKGGTVCAAVA